MKKEYKKPEQLIEIMKQRNINFKDDEEMKLVNYLRYYSYNMVVNPYKVLYCSKVKEDGSHVYENQGEAAILIDLFKKSLELNNMLFKHISDFEYNFSSVLTSICSLYFPEIKELLVLEIRGLVNWFNDGIEAQVCKEWEERRGFYNEDKFNEKRNREIRRKKKEVSDNPITNIKVARGIAKKAEWKDRVSTLKEDDRKVIFLKSNIMDNEVSEFFSETEDYIRYSYFHGAKNSLTFGKKIDLFKILPPKYQNKVINELSKIKVNEKKKYYLSREISRFNTNLNILKGIRNKVYHINSLPYSMYKTTKIELYKSQYKNFETRLNKQNIVKKHKFENTRIMVVIKMLKLREKEDIEDIVKYLEEVYDNTKKKYEISAIYGKNVTMEEFTQYLKKIGLYEDATKQE